MSASYSFILETRLGNWESQFENLPGTRESARSAIAGLSCGRVVLLVDDDSGVRMLARDVLEANGYEILEAANSTEALRIWHEKASQISLLLTDFAMPGAMNGRRLAENLLAENPALKVVIMSGHGQKVVADCPLKKNFLLKPFSLDSLTTVVRKCMDGE